MAKMTLTLDDKVAEAIEKFAAKREITKDEAVNRLCTTAIGRIGAVTRYAKAHAAPKAEKKPKAKKAKAKGPLARKVKTAEAAAA